MANHSPSWTLLCHLNYGAQGKVAVVRPRGNIFDVTQLPNSAATGLPQDRRPVLLGMGRGDDALLFDPATKKIAPGMVPADVNPSYAYPDASSGHLWFSNDGDDETGNDELNCGANGSSVAIFDSKDSGRHLKTLCVGRGHHVTAFTAPNAQHPNLPRHAYVSNLTDGTISIVGNDPAQADEYLKILATINLLEKDKEKDAYTNIPNNAFPHGMVFAPTTGKIYNLNNGYGTIVVIDPATQQIEQRIALSGCSNLLLSPDGRFLIAKGADRKADADHVLGKIAVIDIAQNKVVTELKVPDFYPSTFRFSPDGKKLYVTSAATGKGSQKANLDISSILLYDAAALPALKQIKKIAAGKADCGRRPVAFFQENGRHRFTFVPNPTDGTLTILDGENDQVTNTISLAEPNCEEILFSFWDRAITGS